MSNAEDPAFLEGLTEEESAAMLNTLLREHVDRSADRAKDRLGGPLTAENLDVFLADKACLRVATTLVFSDEGLGENQFAEPQFLEEDGAKTCRLHIHPRFAQKPDLWPLFTAYMAPLINYGDIVSAELCEVYGSTVTATPKDDFYQALCQALDE
jgi:hypothetical protein